MFRNKRYDNSNPTIGGRRVISYEDQGGGGGFFETVQSGMKTVLDPIPTPETGVKNIDNLVNIVRYFKEASQPPTYTGEKHITLKVGDHEFKKGSFAGPGTNVTKRLETGSKPVSEVDFISKLHDIEYTMAKDSKDIRKADKRMLKNIAKSKDNKFNNTQGSLIKGKIALEELGVPQSAFTTSGGFDALPQKTQQLYNTERTNLIQSGYGTNFNKADMDKFERSIKPKTKVDNLLNKLVVKKKGKRKKRSKLPRHIQNRIRESVEIRKKFEQQDFMPQNVSAALDMW